MTILILDTFVFLVEQKVYYTIPLFSDTLRAMCSGNKWYKVKYVGNNGTLICNKLLLTDVNPGGEGGGGGSSI